MMMMMILSLWFGRRKSCMRVNGAAASSPSASLLATVKTSTRPKLNVNQVRNKHGISFR